MQIRFKNQISNEFKIQTHTINLEKKANTENRTRDLLFTRQAL